MYNQYSSCLTGHLSVDNNVFHTTFSVKLSLIVDCNVVQIFLHIFLSKEIWFLSKIYQVDHHLNLKHKTEFSANIEILQYFRCLYICIATIYYSLKRKYSLAQSTLFNQSIFTAVSRPLILRVRKIQIMYLIFSFFL